MLQSSEPTPANRGNRPFPGVFRVVTRNAGCLELSLRDYHGQERCPDPTECIGKTSAAKRVEGFMDEMADFRESLEPLMP